MLALLSPAKRLNFNQQCPFPATPARLLAQTKMLSQVTRALSADDLVGLMKLSRPLAELNVERFAQFKATAHPPGSQPAAWAFDGDTYAGLRARELCEDEVEFAQKHVGILSGLYGLLRPLDSILPYRLEMGTRLKTSRGSNLYEFWGTRIADQINRQLDELQTDTVINLASQEYFQAVDIKALRGHVITPIFKERRGTALKIISFSAKRARGAMARYMIEQRALEPEALKAFRGDGYRFHKTLSSEDSFVFVRKQP